MVKRYDRDERKLKFKDLPLIKRYPREFAIYGGLILTGLLFSRFIYDLVSPTPSRPLVTMPDSYGRRQQLERRYKLREEAFGSKIQFENLDEFSDGLGEESEDKNTEFPKTS